MAERFTFGAPPASYASFHRETQRHQESPGLSPGKLYSGLGVVKSFPMENENFKNSSVTMAHTVCTPWSPFPVWQ